MINGNIEKYLPILSLRFSLALLAVLLINVSLVECPEVDVGTHEFEVLSMLFRQNDNPQEARWFFMTQSYREKRFVQQHWGSGSSTHDDWSVRVYIGTRSQQHRLTPTHYSDHSLGTDSTWPATPLNPIFSRSIKLSTDLIFICGKKKKTNKVDLLTPQWTSLHLPKVGSGERLLHNNAPNGDCQADILHGGWW